MQQLIIAGYRNTPHATNTEYNPLAGGHTWDDIIYKQQVVSSPGTIKNLMVKLYDPPGAGKSYTFTLMKNGVAQTLSVVISDTNTQGADTTNEVAVSAGDLVALRCAPSGTPATTYAKYSCVFEGNNANESLILGMGQTYSPVTFYGPLSGGNTAGTSVDNKKTYQVIPTPGTIKNLYVDLEGPLGISPEAYRFTLRKNGVSTTLTCTITGGATTGSNTADEVAVAAGDHVDLMIEPLNSPSEEPDVHFGLTFVATTDGESLLLGQSSDTPTLDSTEWKGISSTDWGVAWTSVEANMYQLAQSGFTLKKFYAWVSELLAGDYTLNIRANGGNTGIAVTIPSGQQAGSDTSNEYELSDYDYLTISCLAATTLAHVHWGLVVSPPPSPPPGLENKSANMATKMVEAGLL